MKSKLETSVMNLKEKYYKRIGSTRLPLIWSGILLKINIQMTQSMWKERNIFLHTLFSNGLDFNEYNMLKTNILK